VIHLVYVSSAVTQFTDEQLEALLAGSRFNNERDGVTGMLLHKDGNFMQVLEGAEGTVKEVHARIVRDVRHRDLVTMIQEPIAERQFPDWTMGFGNLDDPRVRALPGYSDFLELPLTAAAFKGNRSRSLMLLMVFKENMR
jgi:hypothetical protein